MGSPEEEMNVRPEDTHQPFSHVIRCETVLFTDSAGHIHPRDTVSDAQFSCFVGTQRVTTDDTPSFGDFGTEESLPQRLQFGSHILVPHDQTLIEQLAARDNPHSDIFAKLEAQRQIHASMDALLKKYGWVWYVGFSPDPQDPTDPEKFRFAQHIGIQQMTEGKLTGIITLPSGIYPIHFPTLIATGKAKLPKGSRDILTFNREHAFVTIHYSSRCPEEDWWINAHGGNKNLVRFPGGSKNGEKMRFIVQRNVEAVSIFLARVYGAYFDFNSGTIFVPNDKNIGHIKGVDSARLKEITAIAVTAYARRFYSGDEKKARCDLAKKWRQGHPDGLSIYVHVQPQITQDGIKALETKFGIELKNWRRPMFSSEQMDEPQIEADILSLLTQDNRFSKKPDGASGYPYDDIKITEKDLAIKASGSPEQHLRLADFEAISHIMLRAGKDADEVVYTLSIVDVHDQFVRVAGTVLRKNGETTEVRYCAGKINLPDGEAVSNGKELQFLEYAEADNPDMVINAGYVDIQIVRRALLNLWYRLKETHTREEIKQALAELIPSNALMQKTIGPIQSMLVAIKD